MLHFVLGFSLFSPNALLDVGDLEESEDAMALEDTKKSKRVKRVKRVKKSKSSAAKSSAKKRSSTKSSTKKRSAKNLSSTKRSSTKRSSTKSATKKVKLSRSQKAAKAKSQSRSSAQKVKTASGANKTRTVTKSRTVKTRTDRNSPRTVKKGKVRTTKRTTKVRTVETQRNIRSKTGQVSKTRQERTVRQSKSNGARKAESRLRVENDRRLDNLRVDNRRVDNRRVDNRRSSDIKQADAQRGQLPNVRKQKNVQSKWKQGKNHPPKSRVVKPSYTPKGWTPSTHRHGMSPNDPRYYAAGVFYYNQPPRENVTIIEHNYYGQQVSTYQAPKRQVDYRKSLSFGLRGGAQTSNINDGAEGSGLGFAVGYRLFEPIGVEFAYMNYGDEIDMDMDSPGQLSGQLFLFPWTKVSPYVTGGVTFAKNNEAANQTDVDSVPDGYAYGPHGGVGVQFGLGRFGLNVEGRYNTFSNVDEKSRLQGIIGLDYHF